MALLALRREPVSARCKDSEALVGHRETENPPAGGRLIRASVFFIAFLTVGCWLMAPTVAKRLAHATSPPPASSGPVVVMKPIEQIREGDYVLARDERTGEQAPRRVVATASRPSDHQRLLRYRSSDGMEQVLETTDEHPFWVDGAGWTTAAELAPGDSLRQPGGGQAILDSSSHVAKPEGVNVYNFEVEGFHTYYVAARGSRAPPVWVHNKPIAKPSLGNIGTIGRDPFKGINPQKLAGHVPGTPQYLNRLKQGKATSAFVGSKSAEALTLRAWRQGKSGADGITKIWDAGFSIGFGPNGGIQKMIRVSIDSRGLIHGTPWGPEFFP